MRPFVLVWKWLAVFFIFPLWGTSEDILQEAQKSYQQGEQAVTYEERKLAFNRALFLYSALEKQITHSSASLDQALADTYFQLEEYPWAIVYYQRALKQQSTNSLLLSHLEKAQQRLGLPTSSYKSPPNPLVDPFFALARQSQLLFWVILITFLVFSTAIWFPYSWIRNLAISCAILLSFLLGNLLFFYYFTPLEGILIKTTGFYRAPDWNEPQLTSQPLLAGSKIQILQMTANKDWLKIATSTGIVGYIPATSLRPI